MDWSQYPNFTKEEFDCHETGTNEMRPEFVQVLQNIRDEYGKPMPVNSGYRHKTHSIERKKRKPGEHTEGLAADIGVSGVDAIELIAIAYKHGIRRVGPRQERDVQFIHLGMGDQLSNRRSTMWTY